MLKINFCGMRPISEWRKIALLEIQTRNHATWASSSNKQQEHFHICTLEAQTENSGFHIWSTLPLFRGSEDNGESYAYQATTHKTKSNASYSNCCHIFKTYPIKGAQTFHGHAPCFGTLVKQGRQRTGGRLGAVHMKSGTCMDHQTRFWRDAELANLHGQCSEHAYWSRSHLTSKETIRLTRAIQRPCSKAALRYAA